MYDIIIIGGGPAGLFAGIFLAKKNLKVAILEKNKTAGRKLIMSGAGKCNVTQAGDINHFLECYGKNAKFLKPSLLSYNNLDLMKFFKDRGLELITTEKGKIFPKSMKSRDVLAVILGEIEKLKVPILTETSVTGIQKSEAGFSILTTKGTYGSKKVVLATGGLSYPVTGSTGDGFVWAKSMGHKIVPTKPALTPLKIKDYAMADMSGQSFTDLGYTLWRDGKKMGFFHGDSLLTHTGISGPGIINNSRFMQSGDVLKVNFVGMDPEAFRSQFTKKLAENGKALVKALVRELPLAKRFADKVVELAGISDDLKCAELKKDSRRLLLDILCEYEMQVKELGGYHVAMVTTGGVSIKEIHPKTLESRKVPGLYLIGEVTDIDGDTGGYNIQAAVSMAHLMAKNLV
ncbi:MAG: NAD(P)/FAD-dependent oxidoreductase [Turicibacter sp.]|nr:NAD(P)/FAD-dependent oxidoreductase [Turicibacter sp.]